jgi:hypothetical protein
MNNHTDLLATTYMPTAAEALAAPARAPHWPEAGPK